MATVGAPGRVRGMAELVAFLALPGEKILVRLARIEGSAPREAGAYMLVAESALFGTIGGGFAEFDAIAHARAMISGEERAGEKQIVLGPDTGQCCGGRLTLSFARVTDGIAATLLQDEEKARHADRSVMIFGAGHVGKALVQALDPLPFRLHMVETRKEELAGLPPTVHGHWLAMPEQALKALPPQAAVLILTHDHALDFLVAREALMRDDLAYVGMIGSKTKRGVFAHHLLRHGFDASLMNRLVLPIGGSAVRDKRPEVIAALVAAELLTALL